MDASLRRPQLPALIYLDVDKVKREDELALQNRSSAVLPALPAVSAPSPTIYHPLGPPPPYTHAAVQHTYPWSKPYQPALPTPPRTKADEQDMPASMPRHSLPSLSEALGVDNTTSTAGPLPPVTYPHQSHTTAATPTSPSPSVPRLAAADAQPAHDSHANRFSASYTQYLPEAPTSQSHVTSDISNPRFAVPTDRPSQLPMAQQPPSARLPLQPSTFPQPRPTSPKYDRPSVQQNASMALPSFPYGYTTHSTPIAQPLPNSYNAGPIYQPSSTHPPPPPSSAWKTDSVFGDESEYGESVKRHLDIFDLGTALQEIASTSSITSDFARRYGDRLHQSARTGPTLQSLPGLVEVDDMIAKSRVHLDSMLKIRDFVLTEQAACEQDAADERKHRIYAETHANPTRAGDDIDGAAGFAGSDAKKRRGRAAPPGRCHSCNRAETPEWRRGPDGARTLCNACGLHYAKLTRKQQGASKTVVPGRSNLQPKEI